jgi:hypothetical protein
MKSISRTISLITMISIFTWGVPLPEAHAASTVKVFLTASPGIGNQTWTIPSDFGSLVKLECIGSGGTGFSNTTKGGNAGGGGAYASTTVTNTIFAPGVSITYAVGASATTTALDPAAATYFDGVATTSAALACDYGKFSSANTNAQAGLAANSVPAALGATGGSYSGGSGGGPHINTVGNASPGGGGSAGPTGAGKSGGSSPTTGNSGGGGGGGSNLGSATVGAAGAATNGGNGGQGNGGTGQGIAGAGAGGSATVNSGAGGAGGAGNAAGNAFIGGAGAIDQSFDATHGAGGGGGGGGGTNSATSGGGNGGNGGTYGGGGGGGGGTAAGGTAPTVGVGGQGIIVITYIKRDTSTSSSKHRIYGGKLIIIGGRLILR